MPRGIIPRRRAPLIREHATLRLISAMIWWKSTTNARPGLVEVGKRRLPAPFIA
jgi:hypothetical protein